MYGCILILSKVAMDDLNQECWPINCCTHASTRKYTLKQPPLVDFGSTSGNQFSFVYLWIIFVLNTLVKSYPSPAICPQATLQDYRRLGRHKIFRNIYEQNYAIKHAERSCRLSVKGEMEALLLSFGHKPPSKTHLSPHKHCEIIYGAKIQVKHEEDTSPPLDEASIKRIQSIVGEVLLY